jgi:hypothetical protein
MQYMWQLLKLKESANLGLIKLKAAPRRQQNVLYGIEMSNRN